MRIKQVQSIKSLSLVNEVGPRRFIDGVHVTTPTNIDYFSTWHPRV